ncbi:cyclic lactone autoinducer peptide [Paenibacillus sp. GYB003]
MIKIAAKIVSGILSKIAGYFVVSASPVIHRPEIPQELKQKRDKRKAGT